MTRLLLHTCTRSQTNRCVFLYSMCVCVYVCLQWCRGVCGLVATEQDHPGEYLHAWTRTHTHTYTIHTLASRHTHTHTHIRTNRTACLPACNATVLKCGAGLDKQPCAMR